ncbi:hypothetical protein [Spiroplasma taiwanense]|uniref:Uncharacterized protein n=1 Tax=Spiroplasma taiwanense CT-1 TaxID=1276220 RepID=S5LXU6_9MOLU|nr:hypothetical protein [Spiroplasma taiwanense]AGR41421.1 hypothetical protein STAIW_v1c08330 [Spiroplasma taiwanense CT-1]
MNKENITRKNYKMFCLIIKIFWFKKNIQSLLNILAKMIFLKSKNKYVWELYKDYQIIEKLERNQFAVLTHICKENNFNEISKEIRVISLRYKNSFENKRNQFLDD